MKGLQMKRSCKSRRAFERINFLRVPVSFDRETYLEPVDGAAVDQRRKHAKSVAERIADRTHCQTEMEVAFYSFNKVVVHSHWCRLDFLSFLTSYSL